MGAVRVPLMACVEKTQAVAKAMADKDWDKAIALRGRSFQSNLQTYRMLTRHHPDHEPAGMNGDDATPNPPDPLSTWHACVSVHLHAAGTQPLGLSSGTPS